MFGMKRLAVFILFLIPFVLIFLLKTNASASIFFILWIEKVCVATTDDVVGENTVQTLGYNYVYIKGDEIKEKINNFSVEGISLFINNGNTEKIIKSLNMLVFSEEIVANKRVIYGYTPQYSDFVIINNKKVNTQIVMNNKECIVGFPLILGGFWKICLMCEKMAINALGG